MAVAGDVFDCVFLCCPFSHEMSWMRTGTELSHFLRVCLPTLVPQSTDTQSLARDTLYILRTPRYSVMCKVYTGYCGTSEIEHGLCACTVDNPLAKARGISLRTGAQTMLYLSLLCESKQVQDVKLCQNL